MSRTLRDAVNEYLIKNGPAGKADLCRAVGRSVQTLDRWLREGIPNARDAYTLARQCGVSEEDALKLAKEHASEAKESA